MMFVMRLNRPTRNAVRTASSWVIGVLLFSCVTTLGRSANLPLREELAISAAEIGRSGGNLVISLRSEPKTLNPVLAADNYSRQVIWRLMGDLIHINRLGQQTEPAAAASWKVSSDGRHYMLRLRRGLRFSDGHPVDADDVVFSFQVYLDEHVNSPQRDLLIVGGKPIIVRKVDSENVEFEVSQPYGAGERLFDSIAILPRHLLESSFRTGKFSEAWSLNTPPAQIAGLGPFRLKQYVPGQRIVLEKNPYYWKADRDGNRLPYLDQITFLLVPSADAEVARFESGELDEISRVNVESFSFLSRQGKARSDQTVDAGPSLEFNFLFFNQNDLSSRAVSQVARKQEWFREKAFRQAVSLAIDRESLVRLVYQNRAVPIFGPVAPGIKLWTDVSLPHPARSLDQARNLLRNAGFQFTGGNDTNAVLRDKHNQPVEFTILTSASNAERLKMATLIQTDLQELGMHVQVVPLEFRALLERVQQSFDYEACILSLASGDADPTSDMNVWRSNGPQHFWNLTETQASTPWEGEVDRLLAQQLVTRDAKERKRVYDHVQELIAENVPVIFLASPHVLACAKSRLGNFHVAVMEHPTLWNADELYWKMP